VGPDAISADLDDDCQQDVAVLMVNRYADEAEANSFRRAEELAAEGDHAGAAIWRRVTVAIEQLTDTTGPPN
jgi:hypothetical protein